MKKKIKVGIYIFDDVEVLDFAGPFEVFSLAEVNNSSAFETFTIGQSGTTISARNNLKITPSYSITNHPALDILIIPGGYGAECFEIKNRHTLDWITAQSSKVNILASICTGALLLAECGLLDNKKATTHWMDIKTFQKKYPKVEVIENCKFVDEGCILTSAGISAGINLSFHIINKLLGQKATQQTARRMEYDLQL